MNDAKVNYTVTEKDLLAIVFAMEKFRPYLMGAKVIVHSDHAALRYLMTKKDSKTRMDWSRKLDDTLWAYRTAYTTPIDHKAIWALKRLNIEWDIAANLRVEQLNELDEFRFHAYSSSSLYKDKMKYLHDKYAWNKEFKKGDLYRTITGKICLSLGNYVDRAQNFAVSESFSRGRKLSADADLKSPEYQFSKVIMVRSRGGPDKSKGRGESSQGQGKGKHTAPLAPQKIISKRPHL
nr:uncharacterized protein LOC117274953 [Nicotiana tomentosiformis]